MDHAVFIHSSADGRVSAHLLATVTSAAVDVHVQVPAWVPAFKSLRNTPTGRTAESYGNFIFILLGTARLASMPPHHSYSSGQGSNSPPSSPTLVNSCSFDSSHPDGWEGVPHSGSDFHFPADYWCWASYHVVTGHLCIFGEMPSPSPF